MLRNLLNSKKNIDASLALPQGTKLLPEINKWQVSDFVIKQLLPVVSIKPFPLDELMLMTSAFVWTKPKFVFEWGTHVGKSARVFYEISRYFSLDSIIYSIDLPNEHDHAEHPGSGRGKLVRGLKNVNLLLGDGVTESLATLAKLDPHSRSLFFVDGDHSYQSVSRELKAILKAVEHPSILLHDTFYQLPESGYNIGPHRAIEKVLAKHPQLTPVDTNLGLPGMTWLYTS